MVYFLRFVKLGLWPVSGLYPEPRGPRVLPVGELVLWDGMSALCGRLLGTMGFAHAWALAMGLHFVHPHPMHYVGCMTALHLIWFRACPPRRRGRATYGEISNIFGWSLKRKWVAVNQLILNTIAAPVSPAAQPAHRP